MICRVCRLAADVQTELQNVTWRKPIKGHTKIVAKVLHEKCKGCDCQHLLVERGKHVQERGT